jgi:hypothetical protein
MTDNTLPISLQAVIDQFQALTANVKHLTAESAALYRVFEVAMQLVHSQSDWTPEHREQLALAVKACKNAPTTAKAIRDIQASGMDLVGEELTQQLRNGVDDMYRPGINLCIGAAASRAFYHRLAR